jgi:hypothetical protein
MSGELCLPISEESPDAKLLAALLVNLPEGLHLADRR